MSIVYTVASIRQIEQMAEEAGITSGMLMQSAGRTASMVIKDCWPKARSIIVFCGTGNNGGDGYVTASFAHKNKLKVKIRYIGALDQLKGDTYNAMQTCQKTGIEMKPFSPDEELEADVFIDALLGIGLHGEVKSPVKEAIDYMNNVPTEVLSIDIPSGIEADTGSVFGTAVHADYTLTYFSPKIGLLTGDALNYGGIVIVDNLDVPPTIFERIPPSATVAETGHYTAEILPRPQTAYKKDFGHVLVIGGDYGMNGAPRLTALGAARIGAGIVTIATRPEHASFMNSTQPEIMCYGVKKPRDLKPLLNKATVIAIGPGLGQSKWAKVLYKTVLSSNLPLVVDADALTFLSKSLCTKQNWILTPHPGEAARLLNTSSKVIQNDRVKATGKLQKRYGGVCVLKGAGTIVDDGIDVPTFCSIGNPSMATAGMGDLLTGIIAGLVAQGISLSTAAKLGTFIHAEAGAMAGIEEGERGVLATDLLPKIRNMINEKY